MAKSLLLMIAIACCVAQDARQETRADPRIESFLGIEIEQQLLP